MTDRLLEQLEAEAAYKRERLALYRAKVNNGRPTTAIRLRELERASDYANLSLGAARRAAPTGGPR
jgi:hypothetical protein